MTNVLRSNALQACRGLLAALAAMSMPIIASAQGAREVTVFVAPAEIHEFVQRIEAVGTLDPNEQVELTVNVADRITAVYFEDGQRVPEGKTLLSLAQTEQRAQVQSAEATLEEARSKVDRMAPLVREGAVSSALFDEARRDVEVARAQLRTVQTRQKDRILTAPFAGVLGFRQVSVGAYIRPGDVVATLVDDSQMRLDFSVPSTFLSVLKPGTAVEATTDAVPDTVFTGTIDSIDNVIDRTTRSIRVRATLPNPDRSLKAGLFMQVAVNAAPRTSIAVPESAIQPVGPNTFVFVASPEGNSYIARRRQVEIGARDRGVVEIVAGLDKGERVITEGIIRVREGSVVKIGDVQMLLPNTPASGASAAVSSAAID